MPDDEDILETNSDLDEEELDLEDDDLDDDDPVGPIEEEEDMM